MFWFKNKNNFILNIFSIYVYDLASLEKKKVIVKVNYSNENKENNLVCFTKLK